MVAGARPLVGSRGVRPRGAAAGACLLLGLLAASCGHSEEGAVARSVEPQPRDGTIRSATSCAPCHPHETSAWEASAHARHGIARNSPPGGADAAVGTRWMQAYLRQDALGLHRILPVCYDLREELWRDVPTVLREISGVAADTGGVQGLAQRSFDTGCSGCHASGTALTGGTDTLAVTATWRTLGLDCFVCHGPAAGHDAGGAGRVPRLQDLSPRGRTMVCGRCHGGPPPDGDLDPAEAEGFVGFVGDRPGLEADGTAAGQIYQLASFLRSPCHLEGGLTCTDCHDPHGGPETATARGDASCTRCHAQHASPEHTHHPVASTGARCLECHMPRLLGGVMRHQREHRIGVPQPWQEVARDACTACHADRDKAWARQAWSAWWGAPDPATLAAARALADSRQGSVGVEPALRAAWRHPDPLFRAVALQRLGTLPGAASDPVPEVRLKAAEHASADEAGTELLRLLLQDPLPRIRGEAALRLAQRGATLNTEQLADVAVVARLARHHVEARRVLVAAAQGAGRWADAASELTELLALDPAELSLWMQLAETHMQRLDLSGMERTLDRGMAVAVAHGVRGERGEQHVEALVGRRVVAGQRLLAGALLESAIRLWPDEHARERFRGMLLRLRRGT